jgi:hypothetical protein
MMENFILRKKEVWHLKKNPKGPKTFGITYFEPGQARFYLTVFIWAIISSNLQE